DWSTPFIADACVQLSLSVRVGPPGFRCTIPGSRIAGPVCPARHAGSTDVFLEAIASANPGDVLVIDNGGRLDEGCIGDLVVGEAHMSRLAATLCWGAHRDTSAIRAMGAKVWSLGTCPNGPLELRPREADALTHARFGAVTATAGDIAFADDDGVVFVGLTHLAEVIEAARDIAVREGAQAARLLKGEHLRSQLDLHGYLARRAANPAYTFRDHLKSFGGAIEI
ncbi:MAG: RraA family protein, partial [Vicinamibacterales bacterium]